METYERLIPSHSQEDEHELRKSQEEFFHFSTYEFNNSLERLLLAVNEEVMGS